MAPWCPSRPCDQRDFYLKHWMEALLWQASVQSKQRLAGLLPQTRGGKAAPRSTLMENTQWSWPFLTTTWNKGQESSTTQIKGLPWGHNGKESASQCGRHRRHRFNPWVGKIPWRRKRQPTPVFLFGKSRGQRSLVVYSPWGCKRIGLSNWALMHTPK